MARGGRRHLRRRVGQGRVDFVLVLLKVNRRSSCFLEHRNFSLLFLNLSLQLVNSLVRTRRLAAAALAFALAFGCAVPGFFQSPDRTTTPFVGMVVAHFGQCAWAEMPYFFSDP